MQYKRFDDPGPMQNDLTTALTTTIVTEPNGPMQNVVTTSVTTTIVTEPNCETQWPGLFDCFDNCLPICCCASFCLPCFAPQVGSHAGWNPNWCGCHQNGPRPHSLCSNIAVKFIVVLALGYIFSPAITQIWFLVLLFQLRRYLHTLFPSGGDTCCSDFALTLFCTPCALQQQANLVFKYEQNPQYATCSASDPGPMEESIATYVGTTIP